MEQPAQAVNWRELIAALRFTHHMMLHDIAVAVGSHRHSIMSYYARSYSPSHLTGEKLVALWMATTGKPREALPMEEAIPSVSRIIRRR